MKINPTSKRSVVVTFIAVAALATLSPASAWSHGGGGGHHGGGGFHGGGHHHHHHHHHHYHHHHVGLAIVAGMAIGSALTYRPPGCRVEVVGGVTYCNDGYNWYSVSGSNYVVVAQP
jgi:ABC-type Zn2+ transport system substrate-binding protein/surface adhesin